MEHRRRRRRRRRSGHWWARNIGGLPVWVALTAVVGAAAVVVVAVSIGPSRQPGEAQRPASPKPTPTVEVTTEPVVEFARDAEGNIGAVFLGDSLTYGLYASSEAAGYRPQVIETLSAIAPVNATRGGQTGNTVLTVSESATIPADTGLVVLALGTNDVWNTPQPDFAVQYTALADKVAASAPEAQVVCLGVWSNVDGVRNYDQHIKPECERIGGTYIKIGDLFETEGNRGPSGVESFGGVSDDFHPNDTGYAAIAQRVKEALTLP